MAEVPHRRWNPLLRTWVLCSPHRAKRPWQGQVEVPSLETLPHYDPKCYLCPGNARSGGIINDKYDETFIFEDLRLPRARGSSGHLKGSTQTLTFDAQKNDFSAVRSPEFDSEESNPKQHQLSDANDTLMRSEPAHGKCYVIAYTPSHALTLAQLPASQIKSVIKAWQGLFKQASALSYVNYVQIFENKGSAMGCSNPHPHGQAWTLSYIPSLPSAMLQGMHEYADRQVVRNDAPRLKDGRPCLLLSYAHEEITPRSSERVIFKTNHFVAVVPYWATWPYETIILPYKRQIPSLVDLTEAEHEDLADVLRRMLYFKTMFD